MKIYLIPFLLFLSISSLTAQDKANLNKIWISPYLEYLDLRLDDTAYFDYGMGYYEKYQLEKTDSVLSLIQIDRIAGIKEPRKVVKSYKIIKLTSDTLLIHPLSKYSKVFIENEDKSYAAKFHTDPNSVELNENEVYTFVSKAILYDSDLKFDRLYFRSTPCYGACPSMEFEIDSLGNLYFIGQMNTGKYKGNYYGVLTSMEFDGLVEILKSSALDFIPENLGGGIDAPDYNLIISYNGKTKTITGGHAYPYFNRPLFDYLLTIFENVKMKKTKEIEFTLTPRKNKSPNR